MARDEAASTAISVNRPASAGRWLPIRPLWLGVFLVFAVLAASAAWYLTRPVEVSVSRAVRGHAARFVYATGVVEPKRPVEVSSRVTAPVAQVLADEGDHVLRGQSLVILDSADLRQALADLSSQRINAEQDERRALELYKRGFLARAARDKAVAGASSARAAEAAANARLNQYVIRSGIAGIILRRDVEPGDLATPTKTLIQVGDLSALRVTATVDERDIPLVHRGARALMSSDAYPGRVIRGQVYDITPGGDPEQRAFRVRIRPDTMAEMPVGMTLEVNILALEKASALLVPGGSVRQDAVWVVEDGHAKRMGVTVGIRDEKQVEITSGLVDSACVIKDPPKNLKDGMRVSAKGC